MPEDYFRSIHRRSAPTRTVLRAISDLMVAISSSLLVRGSDLHHRLEWPFSKAPRQGRAVRRMDEKTTKTTSVALAHTDSVGARHFDSLTLILASAIRVLVSENSEWDTL